MPKKIRRFYSEVSYKLIGCILSGWKYSLNQREAYPYPCNLPVCHSQITCSVPVFFLWSLAHSVVHNWSHFLPVIWRVRKPTTLGLKHIFFWKTKQKGKTKTKLKSKWKFIFNFNIYFIIHLQNEKCSRPSAVGFRRRDPSYTYYFGYPYLLGVWLPG